jgi:hypothetical protein
MFSAMRIYIEREKKRESGYGTMHSTDHFHTIDRFFIFKV